MNNFTKEELETLIKSLDGLMFSKFYAEGTQEIYKKIKLMISNYCEHDESDADHNYNVERCKKCGALFI